MNNTKRYTAMSLKYAGWCVFERTSPVASTADKIAGPFARETEADKVLERLNEENRVQ